MTCQYVIDDNYHHHNRKTKPLNNLLQDRSRKFLNFFVEIQMSYFSSTTTDVNSVFVLLRDCTIICGCALLPAAV